jgi:hypothetical protein
MIADFEQRFANVLGARLPAPFSGLVRVGEGNNTNQPRVIVGVQEAMPLQPDFGSRRPEIAPGSTAFRRIMRLRCSLGVEFRPGNNTTRAELVDGLDAALYELDAPEMRNGSAFTGGSDDPGFLLDCLAVASATAPLEPDVEDAGPVGLILSAEGWFWPPDAPGEEGTVIGEIRVRGVVLPVVLGPESLSLVAGGLGQPLTLRFQPRGQHRAAGEPLDPPALPFGALVVTLVGEGGGDGAGALGGGSAAGNGGRLVPVVGDVVTVTYTPPAEPSRDTMVVALDDGEEGPGLEIARYTLEVQPAP